MKHITLFLSFFLFCIYAQSETIATAPSGWTDGSGGFISTLAELRWLSETTDAWDESWELSADIDALDTKNWNIEGEDTLGFSPIGDRPDENGSRQQISFEGEFNGNGYEISNLYINRLTESYIGLFGHIYGVTISNILLKDVDITGLGWTGGLVGFSANSSEVKSCSVTGSIQGDSRVGGIAGINYGSSIVEKCYAKVTVTGNLRTGGLIGLNSGSTANDCYVVGTVYGDENTGGVVGLNAYSTIENCYFKGSVEGTTNAGCVVGSNTGSQITNGYYRINAEGLTVGIGLDDSDQSVTGLTTSEFNDASNFIDWDFDDVWIISTISEIDGDPAPYLRWQLYNCEVFIENSIYKAGETTGAGYYIGGDEVELTAEPKFGYKFSGWMLSGNIVSTSTPYTFTISDNSNLNYTAVFEDDYSFEGGDGTENDPYQIATLNQLHYLSNVISLWDKYFVLLNDIDASDTKNWNVEGEDTLGFSPIGDRPDENGSRQQISFTGEFDGNGYEISNLYINRPEESYIGLFGHINGVTISNILLKDVDITGLGWTGGLVGFNTNSSVVKSCSVTGSIQGDSRVGGVAGLNYVNSIVEKCYAKVTVTGNVRTGGLIGLNSGSTANDCYVVGTVYGDENTGGLVGLNGNSTIENCYFKGSVEGTTNAGCVVGYNTGSEITNSYYRINAEGLTVGIGLDYSDQSVTGLTTGEFNDASNFTDWDFDDVWIISTISEIDGDPAPYLRWQLYNYEVFIENSIYKAGKTTGASYYNVGDEVVLTAEPKFGYKFSGWMLSGNIVSTSTSYTFTISDNPDLNYTAVFEDDYSFEGGDGTEDNPYQIATLDQLHYLSNVISLWDKYFVLLNDIDASDTKNWNVEAEDTLGFSPIGDYREGNRQQVKFTGNFDGRGYIISNIYINRPEEDFVGMFGFSNSVQISNLGLKNVDITGLNYVGAVLGYSISSTIIQSFSTGRVQALYDLGGLVGRSTNSSQIKNCYSLCTINSTGSYDTGGLVGWNWDNSTITNSYAAGAVNGFDYSGGLVGDQTDDASVVSGYYDSERTGMTDTGKGEPLSTASFAQIENFQDWDFNDIWEIATIEALDNVARPYLKWQLYSYSFACSIVNGEGSAIVDVQNARYGMPVTFTIMPANGYRLESVMINNENIKDQCIVEGGLYIYSVSATTDITLLVSFVDESTDIKKPGTSNVLIYPNPVKNILNIRNVDPTMICIYDLSGKNVLTATQFKYEQSNVILDVSDLKTGIYLMTIRMDEKLISKRLIIK